ncbi:MAG: response regulator transcription factor [Saprospiraceae bacterium]|nr:response regulator transcription factor [Saprospiraceae bacterium]MBK9723017.1 response regulator transcription factor [Saprospiraceae bacterium]MBK9726878.1 response regulator transcription factor [Saprospiraceae bacterium]
MKLKLILADDHHLVRQGFKALLSEMPEIEIIGEASNGEQVLQLLRTGKLADIILMDVEMPILGGLETTEKIMKDFFGVKVIIISMLNDKAIIESAYEKGAKGFLFKNTTLPELQEAIKSVASGENYFSHEVANVLLQKRPKDQSSLLSHLTDREIEILKLIAEGFSSTEIGTKLFISPRTVDTHRNNLIQKLNVNGIVGLVKFAFQNKLI